MSPFEACAQFGVILMPKRVQVGDSQVAAGQVQPQQSEGAKGVSQCLNSV